MLTDEQLMERVQGGDREALSDLFRRHQKPLYNFFLRGSGHPQDSEDLAMETLLKVFRHAEHFRGTGSFKAWLYHLALNVARDRSRRSKRRPEITASSVAERWVELEDGSEGRPETVALRGALATAVRRAVRELPERERTALLLREYQQLSYQEICVALGMSLPSVKMLILRARRRVRQRLEASGTPMEALEVCL